ncbi:MAG: hypothetical protein ACP5N2_03130 [Candidatus Nanoarchaeia archaeon]
MFSQQEYIGLARIALDIIGRIYIPEKDAEEMKMWEQMFSDSEFFKKCKTSIIGRKRDIEYIIAEESSGKEIRFKTKSKKDDFLVGYEGKGKISYMLEGRKVEIQINPEKENNVYFRIDISESY